ncbi:MAG: hypothetical protein KGZ37_03280 [Nitrosarchaeum sp.]|nr:hypothetical protein [Nitrosarchaeum sp.]
MVSQPILIGIVVGVFFAGLGVGYAILQSTVPATQMMNQQQMQQMMNDPQAMNQWMNTMMQDPNSMNQWMDTMMNNQQFMQQMHNSMMNNPQMNQQMMNMMMENQQFMHGMMMDPQFQQNWMGPWMNNSTNWNSMMGSGMMNQEMMGNNMMGSAMMGPGMMMGKPITEQSDVIITINNIEKILDQVSSTYRSGDKDMAHSLATNAYLENYEYIEGAIAQKDRTQMEKIELMMRVDLRSMINNGDTSDNVDAKINSIKSELEKVKSLFQ